MSTPQRQIADGVAPSERDEIGFVLLLGRALHTYGFPANRLEEAMGKASEKLGLEGQFFSTPTSIFSSFGKQDEQRTFLIRVTPGEVNLGRLTALDKITARVLRGAISPAEGSAKIEWTLHAPPTYGRGLTTAAFGLASACGSRFLGGGWKEIGLSALIGLSIGLLLLLTERRPHLARVFEPVAAFVASVMAGLFSFGLGPYAVSNATLAGLIVLIPGLTLTVAMIELSTQHLSSGTARLNGAFVTFLGIGFGVAVGSTLVESLFGTPRIARATQLPMWTEIIAQIVMSLAFTVLLKARPRDTVWIVLSGALALWGARLGVNVLGPELGVFVGALIVGVASSWYARLCDRPAMITQVPGILLLVPGSIGFRGLAALLDKQVISGVDTTFKMIITAMALVAGTLIANIVAPSRREI
ncbi:MAG: threonine/serine exporter family protein [Blastocatellia bacterium]|nr:threonine/serine exporter family protein [Blastocatellia bacterium]